MYNTLREASKKVGIMKGGERTSPSEKKKAGEDVLFPGRQERDPPILQDNPE